MISEKEKKNIERFYKAILSLKDEKECALFFEDIATIRELLDLSSRLEVAKMLNEGKVFSEISKETGVSSATISRVNKCLNYGTSGYRLVIDKLKEKGEKL